MAPIPAVVWCREERELFRDPVCCHGRHACPRRVCEEVDTVSQAVVREACATGVTAKHTSDDTEGDIGHVIVWTPAVRKPSLIRQCGKPTKPLLVFGGRWGNPQVEA